MFMDHGQYVTGCFGNMESCKNKGSYKCDMCTRRTRFLDDYYDRCCPNCHSDFIEFCFSVITSIAEYEGYHYGIDGVQRMLCPICDAVYIKAIEDIQAKNGIVSFVERQRIPEEWRRRYKDILYTHDHPEIFERENLYLSFR